MQDCRHIPIWHEVTIHERDDMKTGTERLDTYTRDYRRTSWDFRRKIGDQQQGHRPLQHTSAILLCKGHIARLVSKTRLHTGD